MKVLQLAALLWQITQSDVASAALANGQKSLASMQVPKAPNGEPVAHNFGSKQVPKKGANQEDRPEPIPSTPVDHLKQLPKAAINQQDRPEPIPSTPVDFMRNNRPMNRSALYFQTNDMYSNAIIGYEINPDGTLRNYDWPYFWPSYWWTYGYGGYSIDQQGYRVYTDSMFSQGSVIVGKNHLFAVNSGSNSVTMFEIDPEDPTRLKMIGYPVYSRGEFPVALTYCRDINQVCVLNGGYMSGVACFFITPEGLKHDKRGLRDIGLNQGYPVQGPANTASDIMYDTENRALYVTVKGDGLSNNGAFLAFPVLDGKIASEAVVSHPWYASRLSGAANVEVDGTQYIVVADPSLGAIVLTTNKQTYEVQTRNILGIYNQQTTSHAAYVETSRYVYLTDSNVNSLVGYSLENHWYYQHDLYELSGYSGFTDIIASGNFIYLLAPNEGVIVVIDVSYPWYPIVIQTFNIGQPSYIAGLAVYK